MKAFHIVPLTDGDPAPQSMKLDLLPGGLRVRCGECRFAFEDDDLRGLPTALAAVCRHWREQHAEFCAPTGAVAQKRDQVDHDSGAGFERAPRALNRDEA